MQNLKDTIEKGNRLGAPGHSPGRILLVGFVLAI